MALHLSLPRALLLPLLFGFISWPIVHASYTHLLAQSFTFNHSVPRQTVPTPVNTQCEAIHLAWGRDKATGPDPVAPYFLQIYTSTFNFPFIVPAGSGSDFDWAVPFAPGTQYQICMFDSNGSSGGCEAMYTVIPSIDTTPPTCQNVTFPSYLDIQTSTASGPLSQFGWINQCTDIVVSPRNGTPPYTFTAAPALHPVYNISVKEAKSMTWTVALSEGFPFFISVVDALGNSWANGPIHSSGGGRRACLALGDPSSETWVGPSLAVGSGVGGLVLGSLIGIASTYMFMKHRRRKDLRRAFIHMTSPPSPLISPALSPDPASTKYRPLSSVAPFGHAHDPSLASSNLSGSNNDGLILNRLTRGQSKYHVEPFMIPAEDGRIQTSECADISHDSSIPSTRERYTRATGSTYDQSQVVHQIYPSSDTTNHQRGGSEGETLIRSIDRNEVSELQKHSRGPRQPRKLSKMPPRSPT